MASQVTTRISSLTASLVGLCLSPMAQPVLENVGDIPIGAELKFMVVQPQQINAGPSGADVLWDFNSLPLPIDTVWQMTVPPSSTAYANFFPSATHVEINEDGSQIFVERGTQDKLWGYVEPGLVISYSDPYHFLQRPFAFEDQITDVSERSFSLGEEQQFHGTGTSLTHADAFGTLILPNGQYDDVLRLKFIHEYSDSSLLTSMITHQRTVTYAWYDNEHRSALMKIDSTVIWNLFFEDTVTSVVYLHEEDLVTVRENGGSRTLQLMMIGNEMFLISDLPAGTDMQVRVYDLSGRLLHSDRLAIQGERTPIDLSSIPSGLNILQVRAVAEGLAPVNLKFIKHL
jgi:hypothetical protein